MRIKKTALIVWMLITCFAANAQVEESKQFIEALAAGNNEAAYQLFDTVISNKLPQNQLLVIWAGIQTQAGKFKRYLATRLEDGAAYTPCEFEKMSYDLKLVFNTQKKIIGFYFVHAKSSTAYQHPPYEVTTSYTVRKLFVQTGNYSLPGELVLPSDKVNVPLVILIQGSGASDKDASIGPNKIFRDIAVGLAAQGIATLRYDKRTKVYANALYPDSITIKEEITEDAASAIELAKSFAEINPARLYILGHSLGGMVAPKIAEENPGLKGIILLAANARPLQDLIFEQSSYILSMDGLTEDEKKQLAALKKQLNDSRSQSLSFKTPASDLPLNVPAGYWMALNNYHPLETASRLQQKMLIVQGERDYQVTLTDYNLWKKQLAAHKNTSFKVYPKLNHLFMEGDKKSEPKEYDVANNVAMYVITDVAEWIKQ